MLDCDLTLRFPLFGPVLAVQVFDDEDEAVALANGTEFGLVAGVSTCDGARQQRMARRIVSGQVFINCYGAGGGVELPFGGTGAPQRVGLKHPSIAPYGAFTCVEGREVVLSIQNEREWESFCKFVLDDESISIDPRFMGNSARMQNRTVLDEAVQAVFGRLTYAEAVDRLTEAQTAYGAINSVHDLISHSQLRTREMKVNGRPVQVPASPYVTDWDDPTFPPAPSINQHGELPILNGSTAISISGRRQPR